MVQDGHKKPSGAMQTATHIQEEIHMSYQEAKKKYAALGIDTDAVIAKLKTVPVALHCWQGDDVRGFD